MSLQLTPCAYPNTHQLFSGSFAFLNILPAVLAFVFTFVDTMLCDVCFRMLRGQDGRVWKGTYDLHFNHHSDWNSLRRSADMNCGICRVLHEELRSKHQATSRSSTIESKPAPISAQQYQGESDDKVKIKDEGTEALPSNSPRLKLRSASSKDPQFSISAMLSKLHHARVDELYRLDFKMRYDRTRCRRTFILQKNGKRSFLLH